MSFGTNMCSLGLIVINFMAHLNLERNITHVRMRDLLITGSTANLPIDPTAGPITCRTEDPHLPLIDLACCPITITILFEDISSMKQNFALEQHAGSTFMG